MFMILLKLCQINTFYLHLINKLVIYTHYSLHSLLFTILVQTLRCKPEVYGILIISLISYNCILNSMSNSRYLLLKVKNINQLELINHSGQRVRRIVFYSEPQAVKATGHNLN